MHGVALFPDSNPNPFSSSSGLGTRLTHGADILGVDILRLTRFSVVCMYILHMVYSRIVITYFSNK